MCRFTYGRLDEPESPARNGSILSPEGALPRVRFRFVPCPAVPAAPPFRTVPFRPGSWNSVSCPFRFVSFRGVVFIAFACRSVSAYGVSRFIRFVSFRAESCWGVPFRFVSPVPCRSISFRFGCSSGMYVCKYVYMYISLYVHMYMCIW